MDRRWIVLMAAGVPIVGAFAGVAQAAGASPQAAGGTQYVSPSGTDSADCTQAHPCKTINVAITNVPNGGSVSVAAGVYNQTVDVTKPVTLTGAGGTTSSTASIINGAGIDSNGSDYGVVHVGDVNGFVHIGGFVIANPYPDSYTGGEPMDVVLADPDSSDVIEVENNVIAEGKADTGRDSDFPIGIDTFDNTAQSTISNNTIEGVFQGVLAEDNGPLTLSSNTFTNLIANSFGDVTYPAEGVFLLSDLAGALTHQNASSNTFKNFTGYGIAADAGYDGGNCSDNPCDGSIQGVLSGNSFNLGGAAGAAAISLESSFANNTLTYAVDSNTGTVQAPSDAIDVYANNGGAITVSEQNNNIKVTGSAAANSAVSRGRAPLHLPYR